MGKEENWKRVGSWRPGGGEVDPLKLCLWVKEDEGRALTTERDVPGDLTRAAALGR